MSEQSSKYQMATPKPDCSNKNLKSRIATVKDNRKYAAKGVKEFPSNCLALRGGRLLCTAWCEELPLKHGTTKGHIELVFA